MRFLVVDDDAGDRSTISDALRDLGGETAVQFCDAPAEAVVRLSNDRFDCLMIDKSLLTDAVETAISAVSEPAPLPVIVLSHDKSTPADRAPATDVTHLKSRPVVREAVFQAVAQALVRLPDGSRSSRFGSIFRSADPQFRQIAESSLIGLMYYLVDGTIIDANDFYLNLLQYSRDDLVAGKLNWKNITPPDYAERDAEMTDLLLKTGACPVYEKEYFRKDGARVSVLIHATLPRNSGDPGLAFVLDITDRKKAERSLRFLSEASRIFVSSFDYQGTLDNIAHLAVAHLADLCTIDMVEGEEIKRLAVAHSNPETEAQVRRILTANPPDPNRRHPVVVAIQTGKIQISTGPDETLVNRIARTEAHQEILEALNLSSYIVLPLTARGRIIGAVSLLGTHNRHFSVDDDLLAAEELARRAGIAIDNAMLYQSAQTEIQERRFLAESLPILAWSTDANGEIDYVNQRWIDYTGLTLEDCRTSGWKAAVHPDDYPRMAAEFQRSLAATQVFECDFRLRNAATGDHCWHLGRALPLVGDDGKVICWFGTLTDIDDQRRSADTQRFLAEASAVLSTAPDVGSILSSVVRLAVPAIAAACAIYVFEDDGALTLGAAERADESVAHPARSLPRTLGPDAVAALNLDSLFVNGKAYIVADAAHDDGIAHIAVSGLKDVFAALEDRSVIFAPMRTRDRTLGIIAFLGQSGNQPFGAQERALSEELALRTALAMDNARLLYDTRARAEHEELINAIGRKLRNSLEATEIVGLATIELGRALKTELATWAWLSADGHSLRLAPQQYYAMGARPLTGTTDLSQLPAEVTNRWSRGQSFATGDLPVDDRLPESFRNKPALPLTRAVIACPIVQRGQWSALLSVHHVGAPRRWTRNEIALMEAVADTAALALENARKYAREHRVADILTQAFLANIPERLPGLRVKTNYSAGLEESRVGGDFYDAFQLPDGRVALVMADVSGKGLSAAVQTASVKYSLRAFAAEAAAPALVIRRLNLILSRESSGLGEHFVTLFYAVYDPATGRFAYVSAGHETQLLVRSSGGVVELKATGPILGITDFDYEQSVEYLEPEDAVVLFTDGLTEARNSRQELFELERVQMLLENLADDLDPVIVVSHLVAAAITWAEGKPQDDLALMVVQRELRRDAPPPPRAEVVQSDISELGELLFDFTFQSMPDYAAEVRQAVSHWMGTLLFPRTDIEDFQTAVTEAVTNAVRHGSPMGANDRFSVRGYRREDGALLVEVRDYGPGMKIPSTPILMPEPDANGGRGLPLMEVLTDEVEFFPTKDGMRVRLVKVLPPTASSD